MKRIACLLALAAVAALPSVVCAQYAGPRSASVIQPVGFAHWGGGPSCDCGGPAPLTCTGTCCQGYENCCPHHCCLLDCFRKAVRALDCLLPCHGCGGGCCSYHCGHKGGCGIGCCSTCNVGCCTAACPTCAAPGGVPMLSDPFQDDPLPPPAPPRLSAPPVPVPDSRDARRQPAMKQQVVVHAPAAAVSRKMVASPYKIAKPAPARPQVAAKPLPASSRRTATLPSGAVTHSPSPTPAQKSVLRKASLEEEAATSIAEFGTIAEAAPAPPALLPGLEEPSYSDSSIPANPLRK
jgi:hypothetical protein